MFKVLTLILFAAVSFSESTVIKFHPNVPNDGIAIPDYQYLRSVEESGLSLGSHFIDFVQLMDIPKMTMVVMQYISDPEVMMFMKFVLSPEFKIAVWDFESMAEFKEAFMFLESKGYDMESIIDFVNTALNLPPFEKPISVSRYEKGVSGFLEAIVDTLPLDEMKILFESKLETVPEIADLFETINSQEFLDIMRRMRENPKLQEFKKIFESYGFDFKFFCKLMKDIFGDYYQGVFCE